MATPETLTPTLDICDELTIVIDNFGTASAIAGDARMNEKTRYGLNRQKAIKARTLIAELSYEYKDAMEFISKENQP